MGFSHERNLSFHGCDGALGHACRSWRQVNRVLPRRARSARAKHGIARALGALRALGRDRDEIDQQIWYVRRFPKPWRFWSYPHLVGIFHGRSEDNMDADCGVALSWETFTVNDSHPGVDRICCLKKQLCMLVTLLWICPISSRMTISVISNISKPWLIQCWINNK